jgi:hypothetical protein
VRDISEPRHGYEIAEVLNFVRQAEHEHTN